MHHKSQNKLEYLQSLRKQWIVPKPFSGEGTVYHLPSFKQGRKIRRASTIDIDFIEGEPEAMTDKLSHIHVEFLSTEQN